MKQINNVITFFNHKGGVGKSTITRIVAEILSKDNKILIVELDQQLRIAEYFNKDIEIRSKINELILQEGWAFLSGIIKSKKDVIFNIAPNIDYVANLSTKRLESSIDDVPEQFYDKLPKLCEGYDYVFFDLPPNTDTANLTALDLSSQVYLIVDCEQTSIATAKVLPDELVKQGVDLKKIKGVIPNMYYYGAKKLHDAQLDNFTMELNFKIPLLTPIRLKAAIKNKGRLKEYAIDFDEIIDLIKENLK